ncbi:MAG: hypothetical protein FWD71_04985 [Oscillospiraceae bacterium]|nr:hypothetical protein [Oscillospiraceae bacterium]
MYKTKVNLKRIISVILLLSLTVFALISSSCQTAGNSNSPTSAQSADQNQQQSQSEEQTTMPEFTPVSGTDYGGYDFRILGYDGQAAGTWQIAAISEIMAEQETGEPINDAIYKRNQQVESLYNITFDIVPVTYPNRGDFATKFTKAVLAGDDTFDAAFMLGYSLPAALSKNNMAYDLKTIPALDLTKSWWDQNSVKSLSIGGKLNAVVGDVNLYSASAPIVIYANKQIMQDYSVGDLYQMVRDGKWTWDVLYDIAKQTTKDLDGDGKITKDDQVGLFTQTAYLQNAVNSAGELITTKNNEDIPVLSQDLDKTAAIVSKVVPILKDSNTSIVGDTITGYNNAYFDFVMPKFRDGGIMFLMQQLMMSFELRSMDADFAILPFPKYDETQTNYGAVTSTYWDTYTVIPATCTDTERTGNILQAMGYYSQQYVTPAYFDVTVTNKIARDTDSLDMLDIIMSNRQYDLSYLYDWGGINEMFVNIMSSGNADTFMSQLEKNQPVIDAAIQKTLYELQQN